MYKNNSDLPNNFCILPFIHTATRPNGTFRLCCNSLGYSIPRNGYEDDDDKGIKSPNNFNANDDDLNDYWNSNYMKKIRKQFLNGEKPNPCKKCWNEENSNKKSMRLTKLELWNPENYMSDINHAYYNNGEVKSPPRYVDLKLGDLCNLKCRMCGPQSSNQFENELNQLTNGDYTKDRSPISINNYEVPEHIVEQLSNTDYKRWYESDNFWNTIFQWLPFIEKIYATGGEPTLNKHLYDILKYCVEYDYAKGMEIQLTTNLTTINKKLVDICQEFKNVIFCCSIDAFGKLNEYIRYPSSWDTIDKNLRKLIKNDNIYVSISIVVQVYNILNLDELINYFQKLIPEEKLDITFIICNEPSYYNAIYLPKYIKEESIRRIEKTGNKDSKNVINYFNTNINLYNENEIRKFVKFTYSYDYMRDQNYRDYLDTLLIKEMEKYHTF